MRSIFIFMAVITFFIATTAVFAQRTSDIEGGQDHPLISRFEGSVIEYYKMSKWDSFTFPVSKLVSGDDGKTFPKKIEIEGKVTRIQYSVSAENNAAFVFKNYETALNNAGFTTLFKGRGSSQLGDDASEWCFYYYDDEGLYMEKFGYEFEPYSSTDSFAYIAAKANIDNKDIYAVIFITTDDFYSSEGEFTLITQDIIKVEAPETGLVTATNIYDCVSTTGHTTISDIHFDTGQSVMKPESAASLKSIAEFLNANPASKYFIVGHTDNVGSFASNLTLSENMAKAVMNELISKYGVKAEQLKAYGVSSLSPLMSNSSDDGKAKNRRVEIVEQ